MEQKNVNAAFPILQLALSESNSLYTWGSSPQCLRLQAQARKKLKLLQNQNTTTPCDFDLAKSPTEECLRLSNETSEEGGFLDKTSLESHLSPCLVNTSNVVGKITQVKHEMY